MKSSLFIMSLVLVSLTWQVHAPNGGPIDFTINPSNGFKVLQQEIHKNKLTNPTLDALTKALTTYASFPPTLTEINIDKFIDAFQVFLSNLTTGNEFTMPRPFIMRCDTYPAQLSLFSKLFSNGAPLRQLLIAWDVKPKPFEQARTKFVELYKYMALYYLTVQLINIYVTARKKDERQAKALQVLDNVKNIIPSLQDPTLKAVIEEQSIVNFLKKVIDALEAIIVQRPAFLIEYCKIQSDYFSYKWRDDPKYRNGVAAGDQSTSWGDFFDDEGDKSPYVIILKNYIQQNIEPLYGKNLEETSARVQQWMGDGNDLFSLINNQIIQKYKGTPYASASRVYRDEIIQAYQKAIIGAIMPKQFADQFKSIADRINKENVTLLSLDNKKLLTNLMKVLDKQRSVAQQLLPLEQLKALEATSDAEKITYAQTVFQDALKKSKDAADATTAYASAKTLRAMQQEDLAKAIDIFNAVLPVSPPRNPSPQAAQFRPLIDSYVNAAKKLEVYEQRFKDEGKDPRGDLLWKGLLSDMAKLRASPISPALDTWIGHDDNILKRFYDFMISVDPSAAPPAPPAPATLASLLNDLSVSLSALSRLVKK